jgi:hypothetical protein
VILIYTDKVLHAINLFRCRHCLGSLRINCNCRIYYEKPVYLSQLFPNARTSLFRNRLFYLRRLMCFIFQDGTAFHPDSVWKRSSKTCMKLTSAECTVESS